MPSEFRPQRPGRDIHVVVAPFIELQFALFLLHRNAVNPNEHLPEWLRDVTARRPSLKQDLVAFWDTAGLGQSGPGQPYWEWGEVLAAAWVAGVVFATDVDEALDRVEQSLAAPGHVPVLLSEPDEVQDLVARRLQMLRADPALRARYLALLREFWAVVRPVWQASGEAGALASARRYQARARNASSIAEVAPGNSFVHKEAFRAQMAAAQAGGGLYLVALGLGGEGAFYWALDGLAMVGVGREAGQRDLRRRERAARSAARFKVLSDPTRLAILAEIMHGHACSANTVTELASLFGLAQPTASAHMKILREANLVTTVREGNHVVYRTDEATLRAFVRQAVEEAVSAADAGAPPTAGQPTLEPSLAT